MTANDFLAAGKWSDVRGYGESRLVRSSLIWLIVVPSYVKAVDAIEGHEYLGFLAKMELPFSWLLLFFSALFFSIGNVIYLQWCPRVIRENRDYGEFLSAGRGIVQLHHYASEVGCIDGGAVRVGKYEISRHYMSVATRLEPDEATLMGHQPDIKHSVYWSLYEIAEEWSPRAMLSAAWMYKLGITGVAVILVRNVLWVFGLR